jgi:hypothetical protein
MVVLVVVSNIELVVLVGAIYIYFIVVPPVGGSRLVDRVTGVVGREGVRACRAGTNI